MAEPLDKKYIAIKNKDGKEEKIPALHPQWKRDTQFVLYQSPPVATATQGEYEEWTERLDFINEDLATLLALPHDKFWCQAVFDESLQRCLDSYLRNSPRSYDTVYSLPARARTKHDDVHRKVFMTCLRMATHKESKSAFITPGVFGEILYENFLFDIPKLMDLCVLYSPANGPLVSKMITNIFTQQPKYEEDLRAVVPTILQVFNTILNKCGIHRESGSPQRLTDTSKLNPLINMPAVEFQDVLFYLCDTSATLCRFLEAYPPACTIFREEDFLECITTSYECLVMNLSEALKKRNWTGSSLKDLLHSKLYKAQDYMVRIYRQIVFTTCLQHVLENSTSESVGDYVEDYIEIMTTVLSERRFLAHLELVHPFREDRDIIIQSAYSVDETRLDFIQEGIMEAFATFGKKSRAKSEAMAEAAASAPPGGMMESEVYAAAAALPSMGSTQAQVTQAEMYAPPESEGACAARVTGVELESMISSVKDLLPDLGEGFIQFCLEEMDYNIERVINSLLEDRLPPALEDIDRTLPRQEPLPASGEEENVLSMRQNIYDNDEFDVFSKDQIDTSKIHRGKKSTEPAKAILDDKASVDKVRHVYDKYGSEFVETVYGEDEDGEYNDEYDDTYDSNLIGAADEDSADELIKRRPFTVPRILGGGRQEVESGDTGEEEEEDEGPPRDEFIQDPAKIRAAQADRQAYKDQRNRNRNQGQQQRRHDVVGNPKGQGQEKDVVRNRVWKEKNKSSRVNHNRRNLADKKRKV